ncbi:MAG: DUF4440 domain-containing protein [Rubrivivax sp.]|nr:MAG: DUF4440 domain-containing protein [Rubrivivax sp.]
MTTRRRALLAAATLPAAAAAATEPDWPPAGERSRRVAEVRTTEIAFAAAFAARDAVAFRRFLAPDTLWMSGKDPLGGPDAVMQAWQGWLASPKPPFSWTPELVLVLPSGDLARSTGPVLDSDGKLAARFQSVWRRKPAGGWEIVFDYGTDVCR